MVQMTEARSRTAFPSGSRLSCSLALLEGDGGGLMRAVYGNIQQSADASGTGRIRPGCCRPSMPISCSKRWNLPPPSRHYTCAEMCTDSIQPRLRQMFLPRACSLATWRGITISCESSMQSATHPRRQFKDGHMHLPSPRKSGELSFSR